MRRSAAFGLLGCVVLAVLASWADLRVPVDLTPIAVVRGDISLAREAGETIEARVPRNATLGSLLRANRVSDDLVERIVSAAREGFDPRRLRADQPYRLVMTVDGMVREFVYKIDADRFLRIAGLDVSDDQGFDVEVVPYEKQRALVSLRGVIDREHSSLVAAVDAAGENVLLAMALADVFGGDIDFNNDLQPGDSFDIVFEKTMSEGEFAGYGPIVAAEFRNDGRTLRAFRFEAPGIPAGHYDEHGRSLKRFFLRSPLQFEPRIRSGFSYRRLHPVLREWRAHPAIDYIAPVGAPVVAVASGEVVHAGWAGGAGLMVSVRHANGFESSYLHLSSVALGVRRGARIAQGQMVGRVGSTGLSTGPHLDYRLKQNGVWVNPLQVHRALPPGEPVPASALASFHAARASAEAHFVSAVPGFAAPGEIALNLSGRSR